MRTTFKAVLRALVPLAAVLALSACAHVPAATPSGELRTATAYVDAYNSRDLPAMLVLMHDEVQWLSIKGSEVEVFANGKADLAKQMESYLASPMVTTSEIDGSVRDGRFVAVREIARWRDGEGKSRAQSALAVYEIESGLVRRVWYYPETR
ncbi:nuclear transport factor 2 family protein [Sphingorhabdus sp. Alg239-R122]|uniref:nuclear transport factor 2 family protein n=1 Tax=Sphingorhabdus sp. Alg239-R122 TaxID=2305989 RepID=UPI0013DC9E5D|nr:nuclear transport factor 2 family protein [Sphingorhabdus sp. Alg239-R122]